MRNPQCPYDPVRDEFESEQIALALRVLPKHVPFDGKPCHSWFLCKDISPNTLNQRFGRGLGVQFFGIVFVIDIVTHAHKLSPIVAACEKNDRNAKDLGGRDAF